MKALEFNTLRMIILMTEDYSFCEAFEKEGFSPDASQLQDAYDAGGGKLNYKEVNALKYIYREFIVNGDENDIKQYNEIVMPPEIHFNDILVVAQVLESNLPKGVLEVLAGREEFKDATDNDDKLYGTSSFEDAIIECDAGVENHNKEVLDYLEALNKKMANENISYIQLIK